MPHAHAVASRDSSPLEQGSIRGRHCGVARRRSTHGAPSGATVSTRGRCRGGAVVPSCGNTGTEGISRAVSNRCNNAAAASHLGCRTDPRDSATRRCIVVAPHRAHLATLVSPRRRGSSAGRAASRTLGPAGANPARDLADGCQGTGAAGQRRARELVAHRG